MSTIPTIPSNVQPLTRGEMAQFLPTKRAIDVFTALTQDVPAVVAQSNLAVQQIDTFNFNFDELNADVTSLQEQIDGISVSSNVIDGMVGDGTTDNSSAWLAAVGDTGSFVLAGRVSATAGPQGIYKFDSLMDVHPSQSLLMQSRGGILIVPDANLPAANAQGAQAALMRVLRRSPASSANLAWGFCCSGVNLSAVGVKNTGAYTVSGSTITSTAHARNAGDTLYVTGDLLAAPLDPDTMYYVVNPTTNTFQLALTFGGSPITLTTTGINQTWTTQVHGARVPNADPSKNPLDGDPTFTGNKDYVGGRWEFGDIVGFSGSGLLVESTNGRVDLHSHRALNNFLNGYDLGGNDITVSGHSAAGGNGLFGFKIGNASGFFMATANAWGKSAARSTSCGAMWLNQRKAYGVTVSEFNDWIRIDGGNAATRGGVIGLNAFSTFNDVFNAEGVAIDMTVDGSGASAPDPRLQAYIGIATGQSHNFVGNQYMRSTATNKSGQPGGAFGNWQNPGGDLSGGAGTAFNYFLDVSSNAMVSTIDTAGSTAPDVKPWTSPPIAISSITTAAPGVVTTASAHNLSIGDKVAFADSGTLGAGIYKGVTYFVASAGFTTTQFTVANIPNGTAITTTSASSGTLKCAKLNTLPYNCRTGGQATFLLMDAFMGETRIGARGTGFPSHVLLGIADTGSASVTGAGPLPLTSFSGSTITSNAHGLSVGMPVVFNTAGTLPTGLSLAQQYWVVSATTNTLKVSDEFNGTAIALSGGSGASTFYAWYRTYGVEAGDSTVHNGLPYRNALYGSWESDYAYSLRTSSLNRVTFSTTQTKNIGAYSAQVFYNITGGSIASGTVVLPQTMASSYELLVVFNGLITALTWTATLNSKSPPLPTSITGWTAVRMQYLADNDEWNVVSVFGNEGYTASLGTTGSLAADCKAARNFLYGPLTGNCTIANPIAGQDGVLYTFMVKEDATGGRTVAFGAKFRKVAAITGASFVTTANAVNIFQAKYCANDDKFDIVNFQAGVA